MTSITPSSGNVFSDLGLDPEARALEIVDEHYRLVETMDVQSRKAELVRDIADAIRDGAGGMGEAKHPTGIIAKFENNTISIQIEWGDSDTFIELSDEFMAGVRAHYTEDLAAALEGLNIRARALVRSLEGAIPAPIQRIEAGIREAKLAMAEADAALAKVDGER